MSAFRRLSDLIRCLALIAGLGLPLPAHAQTAPEIGPVAQLPVVVVDQDRLFADSLYGQRVLREIDRTSEELAAENRRIEADLTREERALTELRKTVTQQEFRQRAQEFDIRVTALRNEQDAKVRAVSRLRDEARQTFYGLIGDVLRGILAERGALVLLDRRAVLNAVEQADITDLAIARIDAEIGDRAE